MKLAISSQDATVAGSSQARGRVSERKARIEAKLAAIQAWLGDRANEDLRNAAFEHAWSDMAAS